MKHHLDNLIHQITADKKKLGIMVCALALGLLLWGRLILQGVPRTATADEKTNVAKVEQDTGDQTTQSVKPAKALPVVQVDLPGHPGRDLFGMDPNRYKRNPDAITKQTGAKSPQVTPDVDPRKLLVRNEAAELRLESVVTGTEPRAYINGYLLAPGDEYEGFTLVQVTDRHVILTKYGLFIKLRM